METNKSKLSCQTSNMPLIDPKKKNILYDYGKIKISNSRCIKHAYTLLSRKFVKALHYIKILKIMQVAPRYLH